MKQKYTYCLFKTFLLFTNLIFYSTTHPLFPDLLSELDSITCDQSLFFINKKSTTRTRSLKSKRKWTIMVYMSADNDLRNFAVRNIKQMASIGSTEHINILVHLDIKISNNNKITRRYYIEKNKIIHLNAHDDLSQSMDSGSPDTLISACRWGFTNFPADEYALIFWNHGCGILNPSRGYIFNPTNLFLFNPANNKFELDRTIGFIDLIDRRFQQRGICWDDTTGNYLNNTKLVFALQTIKNDILKGKKISLLGFDACLMMMYEMATLTQEYADIMVGSCEVELGTGWAYDEVLAPFATQTITPKEFAQHIVNAYEIAYSNITEDFAQSAVSLSNVNKLKPIIHEIATLLTQALQQQKNNSVKKAIWLSHNKEFCTHFDEPSYIDLHNLLSNLEKNIYLFQLTNTENENNIKNSLKISLKAGISCLERFIIANKVGKNLSSAKGVSIYFPERNIHPSYFSDLTHTWSAFLQQYHQA